MQYGNATTNFVILKKYIVNYFKNLNTLTSLNILNTSKADEIRLFITPLNSQSSVLC